MNSLGGVWADGGQVRRRAGEELVTQLYGQFKGALFAHVLGLTNHDRQWTEDTRQARPREVELTSADAVHAEDETEQRLSIMVITDVIGRLGE